MMRRLLIASVVLPCALWLSVQMDAIRRMRAPATDWLRVDSVHVYDAFEGEAPYMTVDWTILQPFFGEWHATVRVISDGTVSFVCLAEGSASYATDARIPPNLMMDWWTYPTKCRMPPGRYRLDTTWRIKPEGYPEKVLFSRSNVFEIHELPEAMRILRSMPARP